VQLVRLPEPKSGNSWAYIKEVLQVFSGVHGFAALSFPIGTTLPAESHLKYQLMTRYATISQ